MAEYTITFNVTSNEITNDNKTLSVSPNDEVNFAANETTYVTFDTGKWPFTQAEGTITVNPGTGAGPYTVHAKVGNKINEDHYRVSTSLQGAGIQTSGEIDLG